MNYLRIRQIELQKGFTALEFVLVMIIVAVIAAAAARYYIQALDNMRRMAVQTQANNFRASLMTLRSQWLISRLQRGGDESLWNEQVVFFTPQGWPANTDKNLSAEVNNQTAFECWQLWSVIFPGQVATIDGVSEAGAGDYHVSYAGKTGCRFEYFTGVEQNHYFDYNLSTGELVVEIPATAN